MAPITPVRGSREFVSATRQKTPTSAGLTKGIQSLSKGVSAAGGALAELGARQKAHQNQLAFLSGDALLVEGQASLKEKYRNSAASTIDEVDKMEQDYRNESLGLIQGVADNVGLSGRARDLFLAKQEHAQAGNNVKMGEAFAAKVARINGETATQASMSLLNSLSDYDVRNYEFDEIVDKGRLIYESSFGEGTEGFELEFQRFEQAAFSRLIFESQGDAQETKLMRLQIENDYFNKFIPGNNAEEKEEAKQQLIAQLRRVEAGFNRRVTSDTSAVHKANLNMAREGKSAAAISQAGYIGTVGPEKAKLMEFELTLAATYGDTMNAVKNVGLIPVRAMALRLQEEMMAAAGDDPLKHAAALNEASEIQSALDDLQKQVAMDMPTFYSDLGENERLEVDGVMVAYDEAGRMAMSSPATVQKYRMQTDDPIPNSAGAAYAESNHAVSIKNSGRKSRQLLPLPKVLEAQEAFVHANAKQKEVMIDKEIAFWGNDNAAIVLDQIHGDQSPRYLQAAAFQPSTGRTDLYNSIANEKANKKWLKENDMSEDFDLTNERLTAFMATARGPANEIMMDNFEGMVVQYIRQGDEVDEAYEKTEKFLIDDEWFIDGDVRTNRRSSGAETAHMAMVFAAENPEKLDGVVLQLMHESMPDVVSDQFVLGDYKPNWSNNGYTYKRSDGRNATVIFEDGSEWIIHARSNQLSGVAPIQAEGIERFNIGITVGMEEPSLDNLGIILRSNMEEARVNRGLPRVRPGGE